MIIVGENSWATLAEADSYLETRVGASDWFALPDEGEPGEASKTSYLATAFHWLMGSSQVTLAASLTDQAVKDAQSEAALFLIRYQDEYEDREAMIASGVSSVRMSRRTEDMGDETKLPQRVLNMLRAYVGGSNFVLLKGEHDT